MACRSNFISNGSGKLFKPLGFNRYGGVRYGSVGTYAIGISKFLTKEKELSIRVDRSASKAMAYENTADVVITIEPRSKIKVGYGLKMKGSMLRVQYVQEVYDLVGVLDHFVVGLNFWDERERKIG
ncbi:MAG: hypothetical protein ABJG42_24140 [Vibrio splendidus]